MRDLEKKGPIGDERETKKGLRLSEDLPNRNLKKKLFCYNSSILDFFSHYFQTF